MKQKIGTALDTKVLSILKRNSRKTGKPVNQIIEEAVLAQERPSTRDDVSRELRIKAMREFIEGGRPMPRKVVEEALAEDYYDQ